MFALLIPDGGRNLIHGRAGRAGTWLEGLDDVTPADRFWEAHCRLKRQQLYATEARQGTAPYFCVSTSDRAKDAVRGAKFKAYMVEAELESVVLHQRWTTRVVDLSLSSSDDE